jgi:hypothetical protein
MSRALLSALAGAVLALSAGCAKMAKSARMEADSFGMAMAAPAAPSMPAQSARERAGQDRMLIWNASLTVAVGNVSNAAAAAVARAQAAGGYVEREWNSDDSMSLTLRVPAKSLHATVKTLEDLGEVTYRNVSSHDVTEEFVDTDARLKNLVVLRDRLRELLNKATEVKDILAIETELGRIQGELESMEARLRSLKGQVDLSEISVTFERRRVLGPLGYALKGIYWAISKLFVIQD